MKKQGIAFSMTIDRSKWLLCYLVSVHVVMLLTVLSFQLDIAQSLLVITPLICSFIYFSRCHQWMRLKPIKSQHDRDSNGLWRINYLNGKKRSGLEIQKSFVTVNVVILNFKRSKFWEPLSVVIISDAVDKELLRQLRVYLRAPNTFQK